MGDFEDGIGEMTKYRRLIRRENEDNKQLAVIFNDYMNGLSGDPTTEKELPLMSSTFSFFILKSQRETGLVLKTTPCCLI